MNVENIVLSHELIKYKSTFEILGFVFVKDIMTLEEYIIQEKQKNDEELEKNYEDYQDYKQEQDDIYNKLDGKFIEELYNKIIMHVIIIK